MAQAKQPGRDKSLASLHKATDTLSTMLAQEVKELNARQKAQRADGSDPALMKGLKEATAVLKDLAKARGMKGISTLRKPALIERMLEEDVKESDRGNPEEVHKKYTGRKIL